MRRWHVFSSDEFVVQVNGLGERQSEAAAHAERLARQLLETVSQLRNDRALPISASIGITLFDGAGQGVNSVLQQADMALQQAKAAGGEYATLLQCRHADQRAGAGKSRR